MQAHLHDAIHTNMHTYRQNGQYIHTYRHACIQADTHLHTYIHAYTYTGATRGFNIYTHSDREAQSARQLGYTHILRAICKITPGMIPGSETHIYMTAYAHMIIDTYWHAYTHTRMHTYIHTYIQGRADSPTYIQLHMMRYNVCLHTIHMPSTYKQKQDNTHIQSSVHMDISDHRQGHGHAHTYT